MTYQLQSAPSPNHGAQTVPRPCRLVVLHWWGNPSGQDPWGVVGWLRNPASQVSAHYVIWPGNVVRLLDLRARSWANGHDWANANAITLECDPNNIPDTMTTVVELLADLVRSGDLAPDFELRGHRDYYSTACPGAYYQWLPTIRQRVTDALTDKPQPQEDEMTPDQNAKLLDIWWRLTQPEGLATIANTVLDTEVPRGGMEGTELDGPTTLRAELSWLTSAQARMINALDALEKRLAAIEGADK